MLPMKLASLDPLYLRSYLSGCVVSAGDSDLHLGETVHVAVVHDSSGYQPTAAISVSHTHKEDALWDAHRELYEFLLEHYPDHVEELQNEYGARWEETLVESFDGMTWTLPANVAADIICNDTYAHRYVFIHPN